MIKPRQMKFYRLRDIDKIPQLQNLSDEKRFEIKVVSNVLPFRTNNYVVEELINWDNVPEDPIFQLTFMQKGMLLPENYDNMAAILKSNATPQEIKSVADKIRFEMNPHP